jgi:hypothetical protein
MLGVTSDLSELVFRRPRIGPHGHRKPSLTHSNSTVFYSTRTPIPHPTTANQAGTSPNQHQLNSQTKPLKTSYRTRNHKKTSHPTRPCDFLQRRGKNSHFKTDAWGSAALGIYYFTNGGQDTQHPYQLRTEDFYHASILTNNNKISFILISSTIHPSITSLPSLPSKPSKSGFYIIKHPM